MTRYAIQRGRALLYMLLVVSLAATLIWLPSRAVGGAYSNPFWTNLSPSPECSTCEGCTCYGPAEFSPEGVSVRTGELAFDVALFSRPGMLQEMQFGLQWRSMRAGKTQVGNGFVPTWEVTAEIFVLNPGAPNGPAGHEVRVRRATGLIDVFGWNGSEYFTDSCLETDSLTTDQAGRLELTNKFGDKWTFDADGMPLAFRDRNGNTDTYTYNGAYQLSSIVDNRGFGYATTHNSNGYLSSITDPAGRIWSLSYDSNDNLTSILSPATQDQPNGILTAFQWDTQNRMTGVTDGRGNTVRTYAYVGSTGQIDHVTIDGHQFDYVYQTGVTSRIDPLGNESRFFYSGQSITKTEMLIGGTSQFATEYRYNGAQLTTIVKPRGNRIDLTRDNELNLVEYRRKEADVANGPTDLVESWTYDSSNLPASFTNAVGSTWMYTRDARGNLTSVAHPTTSLPAPQTATASSTYGINGRPTSRTDEGGTITVYSYHTGGLAKGLLKDVELDPGGLAIKSSTAYDAMGNVILATDPNGNVTQFVYDNLRRLVSRTSAAPFLYVTKFQYDGNGNLVLEEHENKNGNVSSTNPWIEIARTYTARDQLATRTGDIDGTQTSTTTHDYDGNGRHIGITHELGNGAAWTLNERGLIVSYTRGPGSPDAATRTYLWDENGNPTHQINGLGHSSVSTYDLFDRRVRVTDAGGNYSNFEYDGASMVTKIQRFDATHLELQRSSRIFDERGRLWRVAELRKNPTGTLPDALTTLTRSKTDSIVSHTDATGATASMIYDAADRLIEKQDAVGNRWISNYDAAGNPIGLEVRDVSTPGPVTFQYSATYDALGRLASNSEVDRNNASNKLTSTFQYDSRNNITFRVDPEGNPARWTFDGRRLVTRMESALSVGASIEDFVAARVTQWQYDANGRMIRHLDDANHNTTWAFDQLDRVTKTTYSNGSEARYVYDAENRIVEMTDAAGNVVSNIYDSLGRNVTRSALLVSGFTGTTGEIRTFDGLGRTITNDDNDYKLSFEYEVIGLKSFPFSETQSYATGTAAPKTVTRQRDALGRMTNEQYPSGLSLDYLYDGAGRLATVSDGAGPIASFDHVGFRTAKISFGNSTTQENTYGGFRMEPTSVDHKDSGGASLARMDYAFDGNHDRLFERFGGPGAPGNSFERDRMRRLTKVWQGSTSPASPQGSPFVSLHDFGMDRDGNRDTLSVTPFGGAPVTSNYTINSLNQYTAVSGQGFQYDGNGNLANDGTQKFIYDYRNQLVEVRNAQDAVVANYRYDALGRRVEKDVAGSGVERHVVSDLNVIETYDGRTTWAQSFVYGLGLDSILMMEQADVLDYDADNDTSELARSYFHRNALGSVMMVTGPAGIEAVTYRYDLYGAVAITRGGTPQAEDPLGNPWMFTSRAYDSESGLYYFRARAYSPSLGRFLQRDPLDVTVGPNLYEYVHSRPDGLTDPLGLDSPGCCKLGGSDNPSDCFLKCCAQHDRCYDVNGCDDSSWGGGFTGTSKACIACNMTVIGCFIDCLNPFSDPPDCPRFYDHMTSEWSDTMDEAGRKRRRGRAKPTPGPTPDPSTPPSPTPGPPPDPSTPPSPSPGPPPDPSTPPSPSPGPPASQPQGP